MQLPIEMTKSGFNLFVKKHKLKLCEHQPFNDYRDWYIDTDSNLYVFFTDYFSGEFDEDNKEAIHVTLWEIKANHKDVENSATDAIGIFSAGCTDLTKEAFSKASIDAFGKVLQDAFNLMQ